MPNSVSFQLGSVPVGDAHPTVFVAEVGTFFNQDIGLAKEYLARIHEAGAPVFKTEVLHDPDVCLANSGLQHSYRHAGGVSTEDYRKLVERKVVPLAKYEELFAQCRQLGVPFIATAYDFVGVEFLAANGAAGIKIARDNLNHFPLIRKAGATGLPIIFDAGVVYVDEIARAVRCAEQAGAGGIVINHHPGSNPAPPENHHLRIIPAYREALGVAVGLSCHYRGDEMLYAATAVGAHLVEKGVVDNPDRDEQDLVSACSLAELPTIVRKVRNCWLSLGQPPPRPKEPRDLARRKGLVAKRAIAAGEILDETNVLFAWPPLGISVEHWDLIAGHAAARPLQAQEPISWSAVRFLDRPTDTPAHTFT